MKKLIIILLLFANVLVLQAQVEKPLNLNKPDREKWFSELFFGMFIHWSFDVQLGMVISHSMVGASDDYLERYINELPKTFNPDKFDAAMWAKEARMAGMKYVVFTTKHHNGFCMFDTKTTDFSIMNTPYGKDITREVLDAFRKEGLAIGVYYSPDDFYFLYKQGTLISRTRPEAVASHNQALNDYAKAQMKELMTQYGKIDIVFIDGYEQYGETELAKVCWEIDPDIVVTRGAIQTPEQTTPDSPIPAPWEACYTLGDQWQYRPTNEHYKSAKDAIIQLIDIRAKGGNFLLNFGPDAEGVFPPAQRGVLNEIALWMFINGEAFDQTIPFEHVKDGNIWFLQNKSGETLYLFIVEDNWKFGDRKSFQINSLKIDDKSKISVLGHNGKVLEYSKDTDPAPGVKNTDKGIEISVMRAQRIYNDKKWNNPLVVKIEGVTKN